MFALIHNRRSSQPKFANEKAQDYFKILGFVWTWWYFFESQLTATATVREKSLGLVRSIVELKKYLFD